MQAIVGKRILIVEDNCLIGEVIADVISGAGGKPIGPVLSESEALDTIRYDAGMPDAAVLDLRLDGKVSDVASRLQELGVPFVFATGNRHDIPARFRDVPVCEKPYTPPALLGALQAAFEADRAVA